MAPDADEGDSAALAPDEAFAVLGNETRIQIIQALGEADGPRPFSELRDRVGVSDSGQFNYHLDQLVGHFVRRADDGYELRQPGRRVIEAILSGAVTGAPTIEAVPAEVPCVYCGSDTEVSFRQERLLWRCTECAGTIADESASTEAFGTLPTGTIDIPYLPAAGVQDRSPREMLEASDTWSAAERLAMTNGVCPRCAGTVEDTLTVCDGHDEGDGVCEDCNTRLGVTVRSRCTNCRHTKVGALDLQLLADPAFRAAFDRRGVDIIATPLEDLSALVIQDHEVLEADPFRARITYDVAGETVTLLVDDEFTVTEIED